MTAEQGVIAKIQMAKSSQSVWVPDEGKREQDRATIKMLAREIKECLGYFPYAQSADFLMSLTKVLYDSENVTEKDLIAIERFYVEKNIYALYWGSES